MRRMQHAPRTPTILVAVVLVLVAFLGTFARVLPENVGIGAAVLATVVMLLGVLFEGI